MYDYRAAHDEYMVPSLRLARPSHVLIALEGSWKFDVALSSSAHMAPHTDRRQLVWQRRYREFIFQKPADSATGNFQSPSPVSADSKRRKVSANVDLDARSLRGTFGALYGFHCHVIHRTVTVIRVSSVRAVPTQSRRNVVLACDKRCQDIRLRTGHTALLPACLHLNTCSFLQVMN